MIIVIDVSNSIKGTNQSIYWCRNKFVFIRRDKVHLCHKVINSLEQTYFMDESRDKI